MTATEHPARAAAQREYLTLTEAAELVRLHRQTLRTMSDAGEFPALIKVSERKWIVKRAEVEAWLEARTQRAGAITQRAEQAAAAVALPEGLLPRRRRQGTGGKGRQRAQRSAG